MELKSVIEARRSIRRFRPDPIPEEHIEQILEAARLAPSGGNTQPWRFVLISSPAAREKLKELTLGFVATAPLTIACCTDLEANRAYRERYRELLQARAFEGVQLKMPEGASPGDAAMNADQLKGYLNLNTAIAVEHMILRATDLGLGSCWVMMFDRKKLADWLELAPNLVPVCLLPLGYADQQPLPRPRKGLNEIVLKKV